MLYPSPLGSLLVAARGDALVGLWVEGQRFFPPSFPEPCPENLSPVLLSCRDWLDRYFAGEKPEPWEGKLEPSGTAFQKRVWELLREIPYGETRSYGELARMLDSSPRAVGSAVGRNPISLIIPCHRVLGSGGALTGYAGGLERKEFLLRLERK